MGREEEQSPQEAGIACLKTRFEEARGELVWPEGSVTGTAVTYVRVRVTIR